MKLTFLAAHIPLTKTFTKEPDGSISKSSYPQVYEFTSIEEDARDLADMERLLKKHAALGHCLLKGNVSRPLVKESRAGSTDAGALTEWIVLDIDGVRGVAQVDDLLHALRLEHVSHIIQYSASQQIGGDALRAHVYLHLARALAAPLIKQWLIQLNHATALLRNALALTRTGNALRWALDVTACQNDKLIYIAPPALKGIKDPFKGKQRIVLVQREHPSLLLNEANIANSAQNRVLTDAAITALRTQANYPARKFATKMIGNVEVLPRPDACTVTGIKAERGFIYFNLNGGDSWGYYHPEDNPEFIHNFKGEPAYLTRELLPDYWQELSASALRTSAGGITYLAFCDRKSGQYWRGTYDAQDDYLDLYMARNETQIRHFAKQHGMPLGDFIPEWDLVFDPHGSERIDLEHKTVNLFQPTAFMRAAKPANPRARRCPPTIRRIIHHVLGSNDVTTERFVNWLAYIVQQRDRARTAWVLHGVPGTGKGILMNKILRPLFGQAQTAARRAEDLNEPYNAYLRQCFIVYVDEIEARALINERGVMANLKNYITEPFITVRAMYAAAHEARNYTSWLFASNKSDPVLIDVDDRRFNTGAYQSAKLVITPHEIDVLIPQELQLFFDHLAGYAVDEQAATTPAESVERSNMISMSQSSIDTVASHLLKGNFEFFIDLLPTTTAWQHNALEANKVENYRDVLKAVLARTRPDGSCNISRDELRAVFHYAIGNMPDSPNKFTSLLKHHRMHTTKVWVDNRAVYGLAVTWADVAAFAGYAAALSPAAPKLAAVK